MERLCNEVNAQLHHVHFEVGRLESAGNEKDAQSVVQNIYVQIGVLENSFKKLDDYVMREPPNRRQTARMRVDQMKSDYQNLQHAVNRVHAKMTNKWQAASARDELMHQRFRPNASTSLSLGEHGHELQLNDRLQSSHNSLDQLISQGSSVLESLRSQHVNLRGVRRKMLDVGAALGLSNTTLEIIDRRVREDWFIFCVGCVIFCIFMYVFYRFWKG